MSLFDNVKDDLKEAMQTNNRAKKTALRDIISKVQVAEAAEGRESREPLLDEEVLKIIAKVDNEYGQSIDAFTLRSKTDATAQDNVDFLSEERKYVASYLPKKMTADEIEEAAKDFIKDTVYKKKDMGLIIKAMNVRYANQLDGKTLASTLGRILS